MTFQHFQEALIARFGSTRVRAEAPLAPLTTFKVGGPAQWLLETTSAGEIVDALRLAHQFSTSVTMLGGGSNVLIADDGIRGLVIRPRGGHVEQLAPDRIRVDAPMTINGLVRWTLNHGVAGPGSLGRHAGDRRRRHFRQRPLRRPPHRRAGGLRPAGRPRRQHARSSEE